MASNRQLPRVKATLVLDQGLRRFNIRFIRVYDRFLQLIANSSVNTLPITLLWMCGIAAGSISLLFGCTDPSTGFVRTFGSGTPQVIHPSWSAGRDSAGRLIVNSGELGNIAFQSEYRSSHPREADFTGPTPVDRVAYDWNLDGYEGRSFGSFRTRGEGRYENLDLAHPAWKDGAFRNVLIKNWHLKNAYKTNPEPHVDITQVFDSVGWGGWFVVQDSSFKNSDDGLVQWQFGYQGIALPAHQGKQHKEFAGLVVQGVTLKQEAGFVADAVARNDILGTDPVVNQGNHIGSWNGPNVGWFINFKTNGWPVTLQQRWEMIIVVGILPDFLFRTGDSYAFSVAKTPTPGQHGAFGGRIFHYPTIESALAAGHREPPFIRLSTSGWGNPQANAPLAQPSLPPEGW